jgi:hypothetical protein
MDSIRDTAFGLLIWYAFLAALCGVLLIALNDLDAPAAMLAAANVALLFAVGLIAKAYALSEHTIMRGQFWRALPARERPRGEGGRRVARTALEQTLLHFAKGAAAIAIVLCTLAYAAHETRASAQAPAHIMQSRAVE